jgi:hypothetical protein
MIGIFTYNSPNLTPASVNSNTRHKKSAKISTGVGSNRRFAASFGGARPDNAQDKRTSDMVQQPLGQALPNATGRCQAKHDLQKLIRKIIQFDKPTAANLGPCLGDLSQELLVVLQLVIEPLILVAEPDDYRGRLAVAGNQHVVLLRLPDDCADIVAPTPRSSSPRQLTIRRSGLILGLEIRLPEAHDAEHARATTPLLTTRVNTPHAVRCGRHSSLPRLPRDPENGNSQA